MQPITTLRSCVTCSEPISDGVYDFSTDRFLVPLCITCQRIFENSAHGRRGDTFSESCHLFAQNSAFKPTVYARKLYMQLLHKGENVSLEQYDRHKRIDIVIHDAKIHIEVDGSHHNIEGRHAIKDLWRTLYSLQDGYYTLRVPNAAIYEDVATTADAISKISNERKKELQTIGNFKSFQTKPAKTNTYSNYTNKNNQRAKSNTHETDHFIVRFIGRTLGRAWGKLRF